MTAQEQVAERVRVIVAAFGGNVSPAQRADIERTCQLEVIAEACRADLLSGSGAVQLGDLMKAETIAAEARASLKVPVKHAVSSIRVNYVDDLAVQLKDTPLGESEAVALIAADRDKVEKERDAARAEVERLTRALSEVEARAAAAPTAAPLPDNVVTLPVRQAPEQPQRDPWGDQFAGVATPMGETLPAGLGIPYGDREPSSW
jgi:hypothetical protein